MDCIRPSLSALCYGHAEDVSSEKTWSQSIQQNIRRRPGDRDRRGRPVGSVFTNTRQNIGQIMMYIFANNKHS